MLKHVNTLALAALAVISVAYLSFVREELPDDLAGFYDGLIATFVGALLSIVVGIHLFNHHREAEKRSDRERLRAILEAESKDISNILGGGEGMTITLPSGTIVSVLVTWLSPLAHEDAARSGEFDAVMTENLFHISRKIRMYNLKVGHLMALVQSRAEEQFLIHAAKNVTETQEAILKDCNTLKKQMVSAKA